SPSAAVSPPETTSPTCATVQRLAPTVGPTGSDHRHPGSYVARPMLRPPICTTSNFPFSMTRVSSGKSNCRRITSVWDALISHLDCCRWLDFSSAARHYPLRTTISSTTDHRVRSRSKQFALSSVTRRPSFDDQALSIASRSSNQSSTTTSHGGGRRLPRPPHLLY